MRAGGQGTGAVDATASRAPDPQPMPLLLAQGFLQGAAAALFVVAAVTLFLAEHGIGRLPWVYLVAALVIPLISFGYNALAQRTATSRLILTTLTSILVVFLGAWLVAVTTDATWVSFLLMVLLFFLTSYVILIQNVLASPFFNVREMKQKAPVIMAATLAGTVIFGALTPVVIAVVTDVAHFMLIAAVFVAAVVAVAWSLVTRHPDRFGRQTAQEAGASTSGDPVTIRQVLRVPYVRKLFVYQFMSSLGTRLVLFIFMGYAARQFASDRSLATFIGAFNSIARVVTIAVLLLVVRPLLQKIGMRFGLLTNPILVTIATLVVLAAAVIAPERLSLIFWTVVIARAVDLVFTFSSTEASVRTAYQVVPEQQRVAAIAAIEGISVPLSIGFAGLALLLIEAIDRAGDKTVLTFIVLICALWVVSSWRATAEYRDTLVAGLSAGQLNPVHLSLDDGDTTEVVIGLLESENPGVVRYALDLLEANEHPGYSALLVTLLDREPDIAVEAAQRLGAAPVGHAYPSLLAAVDGSTSLVRAAAIPALVAADPERARPQLTTLFADPDARVRDAALAAAIRADADPSAQATFASLAASPDEPDRVSAARIAGAIGTPDQAPVIVDLLDESAAEVRLAAIRAAGAVHDLSLLPPLVDALAHHEERSPAMASLIAHGSAATAHIDQVLTASASLPYEGMAACLRHLPGVLVELGDDEATRVLVAHLEHPDPELRRAVGASLARLRQTAPADCEPAITARLSAEFNTLDAVEAAAAHLDGHEPSASLRAALEEHALQIRTDAMTLLGLLYGPHPARRAAEQLALEGPGRALAIEAIESMVDPEHRASVRRVAAIPATVNQAERDPESAREAVIAAQWHPWVTTVAEHIQKPGHKNDSTQRSGGDTGMHIIEKVALLKQASLFASTPDHVVASVAAVAEPVYVLPGASLMRRGDASDELYVIATGQLAASSDGAVLATMGPGEMIGELAIFNDEPRAADVTAVAEASLLALHRRDLTEVMAARPEVAHGIIAALSRRLVDQTAGSE